MLSWETDRSFTQHHANRPTKAITGGAVERTCTKP